MLTQVPLVMFALAVVQPVFAGAPTDSVRTEAQACSVVQKLVATASGLPPTGPKGMGWFCDHLDPQDKWFVLALRSNRKCEGICSNLMGWYAVNKASGKVHEYNVANLEVGAVIEETHPLPNNSLQRP